MKKRNLVIVSNRLPVTVNTENGVTSIMQSSGGLVSALNSFLSSPKIKEQHSLRKVIWIGSTEADEKTWKQANKKFSGENFEYAPVFVEKETNDLFYNGFSNSTLWPLFHYFPSFATFKSEFFEAYSEVNRLFANAVLNLAGPNDIVWIHDYQLMLLPQMIREKNAEAMIGFFFHIPFPSYEIYRLLPKSWRESLLKGMLGADLIGFHTNDYVEHFLKSVHMLLGVEDEMRSLKFENRMVKADVFPISIDYRKFFDAFDNPLIMQLREELRQLCQNRKIIFSVDRLDYTKGVTNRLIAYHHFLKKFPEYTEKVVFLLLIVPSRALISQYSESKQEINELVGHINSTFGNMSWQPVLYQYRSVDFENLLAYYTCCDLALITPLRDGMNLVAKEFVASRKDKKGILILSEMTGAASELHEALIINPTDKEDVALKIKDGLEMSEEEQHRRIEAMQHRLKDYDVICWGNDFLSQLNAIKQRQQEQAAHILSPRAQHSLIRDYQNAKRRLLLFDYDGTLVPLARLPQLASPGDGLFKIIGKLTEDVRNSVFIVSGRTRSFLEKWFSNLPVNLVAEHGALLRWKNSQWKSPAANHKEWKAIARNIMQTYMRRCANSFVEEKEFSLAWHYRNADPKLAELRSIELYNELNDLFRNYHVQVLKGNKVIEVRNMGLDKGTAAIRIKNTDDYDFILAIGDDKTDEDMFRALDEPYAWTVKVGDDLSSAKYNLPDSENTISLLKSLAAL
ncbi:MAG: bifunctional alpha,alpha-trehalose-phosphate synthase (UDP-forming)/trehalose-phosphatase [Chitinophagales bacterium]